MIQTFLIRFLGGYIMKKFFIAWLLPSIYDALLNALTGLSKRSDNTIDDALVASLNENRDRILSEIKASL